MREFARSQRGFIIDPYRFGDSDWSSVVLYLPLDGADEDITTTDISPSPRTININGTSVLKIRTAQSKFGGSSVGGNCAGFEAVTATHNALLNLPGDLTIECHCRWNATNTTNFSPVFAAKRGAATDLEYAFAYFNTDLYFYYSTDGTTWSNVNVDWTPSIDTWYHMAVSRNSTSLRFFVDGTQVGSTQTVTGTLHSATQDLNMLGDTYNANLFNGYIDCIRITKGVGRYTSNFTAPIVAYPTS